jgi:uncharacterized protein (TIGR03067 family)
VTPTLLTLALAVAAPLPKDKPKAEPGKLEGHWVVESYLAGGKVEAERAGMHLSFDGKSVVVAEEKGADVAYAARPKTDPPEIDLTAANNLIPGIYKIEGDTLLLCFPKAGGTDRPKKFASPAGTTIVLMTLKRDKKKD